MAFDIQSTSTFASSYHGPVEFADLTADSPVMNFGTPMSRFRLTVLLKAGAGAKTFSMQLATDAEMIQNVGTAGNLTLDLSTNPSAVVQLISLRGPGQYSRILLSGGGATYDMRLEWNNV